MVIICPIPNYWIPERCNNQLCTTQPDLGSEFEVLIKPNHPQHGTVHVKLISIGGSTPTVTNACNYGQNPPLTGLYNCPHYYNNFVSGNCLPDPAYGCTDPNATNYDPNAIVDDGSCFLAIYGCTDPAANNYDPSATTDDGSCTFTDTCHMALFFESCDNPNNVPGWNPGNTGQVGSMTFINGPGIDPCLGCNGVMCVASDLSVNGGPAFALDSITGALPGVIGKLVSYDVPSYGPISTATSTVCPDISGCTNPIALNYDPLAVVDDGSCLIYGCTDPQANNYDPNATVDDGSCTFDILGCTDASATNYDPNANVDDGSCIWEGCTDPLAVNYLDNCAGNSVPNANVDDGCCDFLGCTDPGATNYDPNATIDDGSCVFPPVGCTDPSATNFNPLAVNDDGSCYWEGCTDPTATNYLFNCAGASIPNADTDDGCCIYPVYGCTDPLATNYNSLATVDDGTCLYPIPGCTDPLAVNYDPLATVDDGSCDYLGCTDPQATNYNPNATIDDGSCIYPVPGCTDPLAANYDPAATVDDGSCIYPGCTDPMALNYDPNATVDDGSCVYPTPGCPDTNVVGTIIGPCLTNGCEVYNPNNPGTGCPDNNGIAIQGDDSCCCLLGCTDPIALNFDPLACIDDGSCTLPPPLDCTCCEVNPPGTINLPVNMMVPPTSPLYTQGCVGLNGPGLTNCGNTQGFDPTDCEPDCNTFDFSSATNQPNSLGGAYNMINDAYDMGLLNNQAYGVMDGNSAFCWEFCVLGNGTHWACDCCGDIHDCDQDWYWPKPYGCWTCDALQGSTCSQQSQSWMSNNMSANYYNNQADCVVDAPINCPPKPTCDNTPEFCSTTPSLTPQGSCWICHHGHVCLPVYDYLEYGSGPPGSTGTYAFMMNWLVPQGTNPQTYKTPQGSDLYCNSQDCVANSPCTEWDVYADQGCEPPPSGCPPGEVWWPYPKCECALPKVVDPVDKEKEKEDIKKIDTDTDIEKDSEVSLKEEFTRMRTMWKHKL